MKPSKKQARKQRNKNKRLKKPVLPPKKFIRAELLPENNTEAFLKFVSTWVDI